MPSRRSSRHSSPEPGKGLRSKELHRLLKLSNGNFVLGNKNVRGNSRMDDGNSAAGVENKITSSVSRLLSTSRSKSRTKRSDKISSSFESDSMVSSNSSFMSDRIEKRAKDGRKGSRSHSKVRSSSKDENSMSIKNRHPSRSKLRSSSSVASPDSVTMTAESLQDIDVNIAVARKLIQRRTSNASHVSGSGKSIHSNSGRSRRSKSARKSRKNRFEDGSSTISGDSKLSSQLSMISNLEELSELDATVLSASESNDRVKYSRRSVSSSRAHSRNKGGRTEFTKSRSHRRRKSSGGSIAGTSVYSTDSKSANDILNELRSTATTPNLHFRSRVDVKTKHSNIDKSETLMELLRQSRDVLKEASDFRLTQSRAASPSKLKKPLSIGRSKSDTPLSKERNDSSATSKASGISIRSKSRSFSSSVSGSIQSSVQSSKGDRNNDVSSTKSDLISKAEHSFLDSLAKSFHKTEKEITSPTQKNSVRSKINAIEDKGKKKVGDATPKTSQLPKEDWDPSFQTLSPSTSKGPSDSFDFPPSSNDSGWISQTENFFVANFDGEPFNKDLSFATSFGDSTSTSDTQQSEDKKESQMSATSAQQDTPRKNELQIGESDSSIINHSTSIESEKEFKDLESKNTNSSKECIDKGKLGINSSLNEKNESVDESYTTVFDPWPDEMPSKSKTEPTEKVFDDTLNSTDPFSIDSSFDEGWKADGEIPSDSFNPFTNDKMPNPDESFMTHEDPKNLSVLSYSKGESMIDFFDDMNLDSFALSPKPTDEEMDASDTDPVTFQQNHSQTPVVDNKQDDAENDDSFEHMLTDVNRSVGGPSNFEGDDSADEVINSFGLETQPSDEVTFDEFCDSSNQIGVIASKFERRGEIVNSLNDNDSSDLKSSGGDMLYIGSIDENKEMHSEKDFISPNFDSFDRPFDESYERTQSTHKPSKATRSVQFAENVESKEIPIHDAFVANESTLMNEIDIAPSDESKEKSVEVGEEAKFMMGFVSDFPNNSFDAWDSTDDINFDKFKNLDDKFDAFEMGKRLSFDKVEVVENSEKFTFNPFQGIDNDTKYTQQSKPQEDPFLSDAKSENFFARNNTFEETFPKTDFFDDIPKPIGASQKLSSNRVEWNSNFNEFRDSWDNSIGSGLSHVSKKTDSPVRNKVNMNASFTEFSTDTTESPSSVIHQDRIFVE